jgi:hypothetical protein
MFIYINIIFKFKFKIYFIIKVHITIKIFKIYHAMKEKNLLTHKLLFI